MKKCSKCGKTKPRGEFYKRAATRDGLGYHCKACEKARMKAYNKTYKHSFQAPDDLIEVYKVCSTCEEASSLENYNKETQGRWGRYYQCRPCSNAAKAKWKKDFPDRANANTALRNARKKRCCPAWLTRKQLKEIGLVYTKAQERKQLTGVPYHVDHIVPIGNQQIHKSLVCGLHVPWNLQLLTAEENMKKSDNFCLDEQT